MSWSALSDCGISWSYSLTFWPFLVYYNQNKSVLSCKLLNCLSVHSNCELYHNNYCYNSRSILSRTCKIWKTNDIKPQTDVHFRDALEHFHLLDMPFFLHKQLNDCMHTTGIASKHFQTTYSQFVPSCHKSIVSVSLITGSA